MSVRLLGPVALLGADGEQVPLGGRKERLLLALLAINTGTTVSVDRAMSACWGATPPPTAATTLTSHVSRLRSALRRAGLDLVRSDGGLSLPLATGLRDVDVAERLLEEACAATATAPGHAARLAADAQALWTGPPLAPFTDEPFAVSFVSAVEELRARLVDQLAEALLAAGRPEDALAGLDGVEATPLPRERRARLRMLALYRSGRQAEALTAYDVLRRLLRDELGIDPAAETAELHAAILRQDDDLALAVERRAARPVHAEASRARTSFVGRARDLAAVGSLVEDHRLVTLIGPGGIGKSRLAFRLATDLAQSFDRHVDVVELARESEPAAVAEAVAVGRPPEQAQRRLLVLDNCEHVLGAAAEAIDALLNHDPQVHVLATSREALHVPGERLWRVEPLEVPAGATLPADLTDLDGVRLFAERAAETVPGFSVTAENAEAVAAICRRVDGIPLALELAASRISQLTPGQLAQRLAERLDAIDDVSGARPARHRTLAAAVSWSYAMLEPRDQLLLRRLAVFPDAFTVDAAEDVCSDQHLLRGDVVAGLVRLQDRSLVSPRRDGDVVRNRLLVPIREFAEAELRRGGDEHYLRLRHLAWVVHLLRPLPCSAGTFTAADVRTTSQVRPDVEEALRFAHALHDQEAILELAARYVRFCYRRDEVDRGRRVGEEALAVTAGASRLRGWLLFNVAALSGHGGDYGERWARETVATAKQLGDRELVAAATHALGDAFRDQDRLPEARAAYEAAMRSAPTDLARTHLACAIAQVDARAGGGLPALERELLSAIQRFRELAAGHEADRYLVSALWCVVERNAPEAEQLLVDGIRHPSDGRMGGTTWGLLALLAVVCARTGRMPAAVALCAATDAGSAEDGVAVADLLGFDEIFQGGCLDVLAQLRETGRAQHPVAWRRGTTEALDVLLELG